MIKVKEFYDTKKREYVEGKGFTWVRYSMEDTCNKFLRENANKIEVIDIKYNLDNTDDEMLSSALVIYKEKESEENE